MATPPASLVRAQHERTREVICPAGPSPSASVRRPKRTTQARLGPTCAFVVARPAGMALRKHLAL